MSLVIRISFVLAITLLFTKVNLSPQISSDYFFSASDPAFNAMYALHTKLTSHKDVGVVVSLPLLMKESKRSHWITKFLSWNKMLDILSGNSHQNIANHFMTKDRRHVLFILRMKESSHNKSKAKIIENIDEIVNKYGFKIDHKGGPYSLQSRLAVLVRSSLYLSLLGILVSFSIIALLVSHSIIMSLVMIFCITLICIGTLGSFCFTGAALDVISSPAIIVCLLLAMDIMIHAVMAMKQNNLNEQFNSATSIILITSLGFTILCFSQFTSMQHFGFIMMIGMVLSGLIIMIVMPTLANLLKPRVDNNK